MKRNVLLLLLAILTFGIATAQNANRSGFFLEAGIGGMIGSTPRMSIEIVDNVVYNKFVYGTAADLGLGGRFRIGNHWAYEIKAEGMIPLCDPINAIVGRFLPIGFRYTSGELWKNYSIYAHVNIGGALTGLSGQFWKYYSYSTQIMHYYDNEGIIFPDASTIRLKSGVVSGGASYSVGIGINLNQHLYLEGCFDAQFMFDCFGKYNSSILHFGAVSGVLGYRF